MKLVTVSSKGQITIPKAVLTRLHVQHGSKLMLYPDKDSLLIKPLPASIVDQTAGSLKKFVKPTLLGIPFAKAREETQKVVAAELAQKR